MIAIDKRVKKMIACAVSVIAAIAVVAGIYALCVNAHVVKSTEKYILTAQEASELDSADCILVLGAGVDGTRLSDMLADRVNTGIDLYKSGAAPKILMSGDHGRENYDEVNAMKSYAIENEVPSSDIFMDHAGFSTYESMYRARDVFKAKKIIIITQKYHLYRAIYIARYLGLDAYGVDGQIRNYTVDTNLYNTFREFAARNKDFIYVRLNPEPTYLGEVIPISGDGDLTNDKQIA